MNTNQIESIHIRNFRLFDSLDIEQVGQVNLITGKNNCGKTTLLEAVRIAVSPPVNFILEYQMRRGDNENFYDFESLFNDWNFDKSIKINDVEISEILSTSGIKVHNPNFGKDTWKANPFDNIDHKFIRDRAFDIFFHQQIDFSTIWPSIDLTEKEDVVVDIMKAIDPNIVRISVDTKTNSAKVRLKGVAQPKPLKNLGEGSNRLFGIALALASSENKILLIDEIDLGLHHSVQTQLWEIVFSTAKKLNVQVFATTHSRDCVEAFAAISPKYEGMGMYFRLQKNKDSAGFSAVNYDTETLESAVEQEMETR